MDVLGHIPDAMGYVPGSFAEDSNSASFRLQKSQHQFQQCRFPTAVRTDQGQKLAIVDRKIHVFQDFLFVEGIGKVMNFNRGVDHVHPHPENRNQTGTLYDFFVAKLQAAQISLK
jgi:hypothetical protein